MFRFGSPISDNGYRPVTTRTLVNRGGRFLNRPYPRRPGFVLPAPVVKVHSKCRLPDALVPSMVTR